MPNAKPGVPDPDPAAIKFALQIPTHHACFADHFPGAPLVPGALLLKWIMALIDAQGLGKTTYLKQVKFLAMVKPGATLAVQLSAGTAPHQWMVEAYLGTTLAIKGQLECRHE